MSKVRNVLIVGGGIGGLSVAIGLGRAGVQAEIVEIKDKWAIYGVGIIQPGNAIRAYKALGVANRCIEQGFVYKRQRHYDADGNLIGERMMPRIDGLDLVGHCGIPRPALQDILVSTAVDTGARIRMAAPTAAGLPSAPAPMALPTILIPVRGAVPTPPASTPAGKKASSPSPKESPASAPASKRRWMPA